jgi:hypothetical protein
VIEVNIDSPEGNREVMVFPISDIPGVGKQAKWIYQGYFISFQFDIRFIRDDPKTRHVSCRIYSANELLLRLPSWPYSFVSNHDRDYLLTKLHPAIGNGIDECRNAYAASISARQWKYLILRFPEDHVLNVHHIFEDAGPEQWCELDIIPIKYETVRRGMTNMIHMVGFKIAREDVEGRKRGSVENQSEESDAAKLIASMNGGWGY